MTEIVENNTFFKKFEHLIQWFIASVGLVYGCGFLIVFTFHQEYKIDSSDFIEAKYIHVGVLFVMACLVVVMPIWWFLWPLRGKYNPDSLRKIKLAIVLGRKQGGSEFNVLRKWLTSKFSPDWSQEGPHGLNASWTTRLSVVLILWSFIMISEFAPETFGRDHTKLVILSFLMPMVVLILGMIGDIFKDGSLSSDQHAYLRRKRRCLRIWWPISGVIYVVIFLSTNIVDDNFWPMVFLYFLPPIYFIGRTFKHLLLFMPRSNIEEDIQARVSLVRWLIYSTQWVCVIIQIWMFIWTIKFDILKVSLWDVFFGPDYFTRCWCKLLDGDFPSGAIYFVFLLILIGFFFTRHYFRVKTIAAQNDAAHQAATLISLLGIVAPLAYITVLTYAHKIYPYIPAEKGGGDYSKAPVVHLDFKRSTFSTGLILAPQNIQDLNNSNRLIAIEEDSDFIFLADIKDCGGPALWRSGESKPVIYILRRDLIDCMSR